MRLNQSGEVNALLIPLILSVTFFFGALGFGVWAYLGREDYKNNSDQKVEAAVAVAVEEAKSEKDNEFVEREKEPYRDYVGSDALGSVTFQYPKTWSGFFTEDNTKSMLIMYPALVPGNDKSLYALRVEVESTPYDKALKSYESDVKSGKLGASAMRLEKLPEVAGTRLDGEIQNGIQGSVIVMPIRDKTLKISVESSDFADEFDAIILPSLTFLP